MWKKDIRVGGMNRIVVIEHLTLDGVMQSPGRPDEDPRDGFPHGGWAAERNDPAMQQAMGRRMGRSWSLLAGRRTYGDFAAFWPAQQSNPFSEALTRVTKYVASTTLAEPLPWANSTLLRGDVTEAVGKLDGTLIVFGSGDLVRTLMRHDLVDEYLFMIHPLVLGQGRRLFPDGAPYTSLRLTESSTTPTGVTIAAYARP